MVKLYCCNECNTAKDWSEMHNRILCKNCWGNSYDQKFRAGAKQTWITRRERGTDKHHNKPLK